MRWITSGPRQELGKGAYGTGTIGYEQVEELCETLAQFKEIMGKLQGRQL